MLINFKPSIMFSLLLLGLSMPCQALNLSKQIDEPVSIQVTKDKPTFTLKEESSAGYLWFLEDYDNKLLHLKEHKYHEGQEQWTFQVASEAFKAPRILKIRLLFGDPDSTEDYEEHNYMVKVLKKAAE